MLEKILQDIDAVTAPNNMSLETAKEFLERLNTEIDMRIDGIKDDIANRDA